MLLYVRFFFISDEIKFASLFAMGITMLLSHQNLNMSVFEKNAEDTHELLRAVARYRTKEHKFYENTKEGVR
jgi:hypothetical protein